MQELQVQLLLSKPQGRGRWASQGNVRAGTPRIARCAAAACCLRNAEWVLDGRGKKPCRWWRRHGNHSAPLRWRWWRPWVNPIAMLLRLLQRREQARGRLWQGHVKLLLQWHRHQRLGRRAQGRVIRGCLGNGHRGGLLRRLRGNIFEGSWKRVEWLRRRLRGEMLQQRVWRRRAGRRWCVRVGWRVIRLLGTKGTPVCARTVLRRLPRIQPRQPMVGGNARPRASTRTATRLQISVEPLRVPRLVLRELPQSGAMQHARRQIATRNACVYACV